MDVRFNEKEDILGKIKKEHRVDEELKELIKAGKIPEITDEEISQMDIEAKEMYIQAVKVVDEAEKKGEVAKDWRASVNDPSGTGVVVKKENEKEQEEIMRFNGSGVLEFNEIRMEQDLEKVKRHLELIAPTKWKGMQFVSNKYTYTDMKLYMKQLLLEKKIMAFLINKNKKVIGKITNKLEEGIMEIPLIQRYEKVIRERKGNDSIESGALIFGEKKDNQMRILDSLSHKFHMYRFISKEGDGIQNYTILSDKKLEIGEYELSGMYMELEDYSDISKYAKFMKKTHIIFVNECKPLRVEYKDHEDFINRIGHLIHSEGEDSEDLFFKNLLTTKVHNCEDKYYYFQHPRYFERLIASFFLSSEKGTTPYPVHLLIIGKQGGGKTIAIEALNGKVDEATPVVEGSGSTMKSLIPSFRGDTTKPGALIESSRIVFVDEFFRILMRVDKDDREATLTHLNPLLEHRKRRFGSGNNFLDAQMTSRMLAVTNPVFGTSSMESLVNKLDNSFLSRILIWYQDQEHYDNIINKKETDIEEVPIQINEEIWKSIFDYCTRFQCEYDQERYAEIHDAGLAQMGGLSEEIKEIYKQRYKHHLACLLDGIIKLRCICEKDASFKATDIDYMETKTIWLKMIQNWKRGLENVRFDVREGRFY